MSDFPDLSPQALHNELHAGRSKNIAFCLFLSPLITLHFLFCFLQPLYE